MNYNPSAWPLRVLIALIGAVAVSIALYLALYQWGVVSVAWDPLFGDGTAKVLTSPLSHQFRSWIKIPDAMLGVLAYLTDIIFSLAGSNQRWITRPWLVLLFGIFVIPVGCVSITLVLLQGLVVKFWCFLCLITAFISLLMIFLAYDEVLASCRYLLEIKKRTNFSAAWHALWGTPCEATPMAIEAVKKRKMK